MIKLVFFIHIPSKINDLVNCEFALRKINFIFSIELNLESSTDTKYIEALKVKNQS